MKRSVYIETSVISYLAAYPSRDVIVAGHQQTTHEWWQTRRGRYDLYVSELVLEEASGGDPDAARRRIEYVASITELSLSEPAVLYLASPRFTDLAASGGMRCKARIARCGYST